MAVTILDSFTIYFDQIYQRILRVEKTLVPNSRQILKFGEHLQIGYQYFVQGNTRNFGKIHSTDMKFLHKGTHENPVQHLGVIDCLLA